MSDPRIPRISEQAREARRLWQNVGEQADYQNASHAPIHRDPGEVRPAKSGRSVKVSDKLPDEVEEALRNCDIYGDDAHGVQTPRASLRLSIAKAIRDAEERMRERCALLHEQIDIGKDRDGAGMAAVIKYRDAIRSLPLENA